MKEIDAFGLQCPKPLIMAKKEIDAGCGELAVKVDNDAAVKNLNRLGKKSGREVTTTEIEGGWVVAFGESDGCAPSAIETSQAKGGGTCGTGCGYSVFIGKDHVGEGDDQLGYNLMKMAIYTLSESEDVPTTVAFMNSGVKLVCGNEQQIFDSLSGLIAQGTQILVCGTCLDYYGLKEDLKIGEVSNMYDILTALREAANTITL